MSTILVTGGAGFIGSNFCLYLRRQYPDVRIICLDALTYAANQDALSPLSGDRRFHFIHGNICDRNTVNAVFAEYHPDAVVNFAAESHVDRSITSPEAFLHSNILGVSVLLDACRKYGIGRFHQISTDEVYGDLPLYEGEPFAEDAPLRASSPYAASKASADLLVLSYHRTFGVPVTISRCTNNYGEYQYPEKLIPLMLTRAAKDQPLPVYGNGTNIRDWLYVEDHCGAVDLILQKGKAGEIYNISGDYPLCNLELVRTICRILGKPESLITFVPDRLGHDLRYAVTSDKIRKLGWKPDIPFAEGIRRTVAFYINPPNPNR